MTVKTVLKWLDTLTAWGFVVGLACWTYDLFMVQSPARFRVFGQGEIMGDFTGVFQVMTPYLACMTLGYGTRGKLAGWPGGRVCWRMLIWMHTRMLIPTALSYYTAYGLYENAEYLVETSLSFDITHSFTTDVLVFGCYLFSAVIYDQSEKTN
ncbi:hypothetical protein DTV22_22410 [Salmonella enterica subsp. enterica serovar Kandla]|nr:hypothetical protein [Salmonella enterica]EBX9174529.1 hypothetical protein [Salmonella enterica subsp. enterica serovar Kandla]EBX9805286.1 hypothetical protein [Salmonella enterica subsp. enterica serovar Kandla]EBY1906757.1 hypothetical protein [Salmonella enterica subsp. enterica serovar Kandla]ECD3787577.1 hypothetical protein [Salmonella enterica subsp. enterica serovar Kandla]